MTFLERLKKAANTELVFWDKRRPPKENMSRASFLQLLKIIPDEITPQWSIRTSKAGKHGHDGQELVFKFEATLERFGSKKTVFVKGFFFTKEDPYGVEIQSCRG